MIEWLSSQGFRIHLRADRSVFLQRGAGAWEYPSILAAFLGQDGPYTATNIKIPKGRKA